MGTLRPSGRQARVAARGWSKRVEPGAEGAVGSVSAEPRRPIHPPVPRPGGVPAWVLGVLGIAVLAIAYFLLLR